MRASTSIVAATLLAVPTLINALPTPPIHQGSEEATPALPARVQYEHGLKHDVDPQHTVYEQHYTRPLPIRRARQASARSLRRYPLAHYNHFRPGDRIYGRDVGSGALSANAIVDIAKDAAKYGAKYGGDAIAYGTDAYEALKAGKSLLNGTHWRREEDPSMPVSLQGAARERKISHHVQGMSYEGHEAWDATSGSSVSAGPRRLVPQGSGAISTKGVLQVGKDAFQIGNAVHDAWDAGKDAWHQIKGRSAESGAISSQGVLQVGHDALQIGNDLHDVYESGKDAFEAGVDAYHQFKSRSMGSGAISAGQVAGVAKDAWTIGHDAYDTYKAGKDAWSAIKGPRELFELEELE